MQCCGRAPRIPNAPCLGVPRRLRTHGSAITGYRHRHGGHTRPTVVTKAQVETQSMTERMFAEIEKRNAEGQAGGAGGATTLQALRRVDGVWRDLRNRDPAAAAAEGPQFVTCVDTRLPSKPEFDVAVCGGTLGIFLATALQVKGLKVAVLERGKLAGRAQEWNISRSELQVLVDLEVLSEQDIKDATAIEFNPVRMGFKGGEDVWTRDVLNLGMRPSTLVKAAAERFAQAGGVVIDETAASGVRVHVDGVAMDISGGGAGKDSHSTGQRNQVTSKLLLDCMGHASPIVRQARGGRKPDGVCCVVGSLASGFPESANQSSDLIYSNSHILGSPQEVGSNLQYFWEAFPTGAGPTHRTTYLFAYMDAEPSRPSLERMLEDYWRLMPEYQGVSLDSVTPERILFGFFPTYRDSPLPPQFDRVLAVGDASGIQSPLSFGGFGALTRHIQRLTGAIVEAVQADVTDKKSLAMVNAYNPGLSSAWMLQRAMSVRVGSDIDRDVINRMLAMNFASMAAKGDGNMRPFLQDVMKFGPFLETVLGQIARDPLYVPVMSGHVGFVALADWLGHFVALGAYDVAHRVLQPLLPTLLAMQSDDKARFRLKRWAEALEFGSGRDYHG